MEALNISSCSLRTDTGMALAEVLASGFPKFQQMMLDVSNNDFGPIGMFDFDLDANINNTDYRQSLNEYFNGRCCSLFCCLSNLLVFFFLKAGRAFEIAAKSCQALIEFDGRMCKFLEESEYLINDAVGR